MTRHSARILASLLTLALFLTAPAAAQADFGQNGRRHRIKPVVRARCGKARKGKKRG